MKKLLSVLLFVALVGCSTPHGHRSNHGVGPRKHHLNKNIDSQKPKSGRREGRRKKKGDTP